MMDKNELIKLYQANFKKIYRFFYYKTLSREVSEDLTSEVFLSFVENIQEDNLVENYQAFLYGIAKNRFMDYLRTKYKENAVGIEDEEDFGSYIDDFLEEVDNTPTIEERAMKYIKLLPEKQRKVIQLRLIEKNSLSEICELLNKDMNYVKTTQKRGLKSLKRLVTCTP